MKSKVLGNNIMVKEVEKVSPGGITIIASKKEILKEGEVVNIGKDVTSVQIGDRIIFEGFHGAYKIDKDEFFFIKEDECKMRYFQ